MADLVHRTKRILSQPGFAGLLGSAVALGLGFSFVSPFLSLWGTQEIGLRPSVFGLYMTAVSLSSVVVATSLARWSDTHVPRKVMLLIGASGGMVGYICYALLHDARVLVAIGVTVLAVAGICFSQLFAHVRERFYAHGIPGIPAGFLMSVVRVCFSVAWTAGPSIGAWVQVEYGFRGLFLGAAALYGVFLLGVVRFVPYEARAPQPATAAREPVWRVLTRGDILPMWIGSLTVFAAHTVNMLNLPLQITQGLGGGERDVGIAFGIGPLAEVPLMLWFGLLAARRHPLGLIRFGAAATVVYFLLLAAAQAPWHIFLLQILHGLSFAIFSNVTILYFQELLPGQPGLATTIFSNAASLGSLTGYSCFTTFAPAFGQRGLFGVSAALAAITLIASLQHRPRPAHLAPQA